MVSLPPPNERTDLVLAARGFSNHVAARDARWNGVGRKRSRWPKWLTPKRIALMIVFDLVVGSVGWHYLKPTPGGAIGATDKLIAAVSHRDWQSAYNQLCSSDRQQTTEAEFAEEADAALVQLGGLHGVTDLTTATVAVPVGPLRLPAVTVSGELQPQVGQPSAFSVTLVRSVTSWQVCLSVGGYSSAALQISQPLIS